MLHQGFIQIIVLFIKAWVSGTMRMDLLSTLASGGSASTSTNCPNSGFNSVISSNFSKPGEDCPQIIDDPGREKKDLIVIASMHKSQAGHSRTAARETKVGYLATREAAGGRSLRIWRLSHFDLTLDLLERSTEHIITRCSF